jgi:Zn-dependent alcohol dehydrogenase
MASISMQAPVLVETNKPLKMRGVELSDPEPHEVRVKMSASGVCYSCLLKF